MTGKDGGGGGTLLRNADDELFISIHSERIRLAYGNRSEIGLSGDNEINDESNSRLTSKLPTSPGVAALSLYLLLERTNDHFPPQGLGEPAEDLGSAK